MLQKLLSSKNINIPAKRQRKPIDTNTQRRTRTNLKGESEL